MDLAGLRLGMLYHYLPASEGGTRSTYPMAELLAFGSSSQALNAVAFGQAADVYIGDTISTHYLLNRGHLPRLRMANFGKHEAIGSRLCLAPAGHAAAGAGERHAGQPASRAARQHLQTLERRQHLLLTERSCN